MLMPAMGLVAPWQGKQNCSKIAGAFSGAGLGAAAFAAAVAGWADFAALAGLPEVLAPWILPTAAMMAMAQNPIATAARLGWVWNRFRFMKRSTLLYWYVRSMSSVLTAGFMVGSTGTNVGSTGTNVGSRAANGGF